MSRLRLATLNVWGHADWIGRHGEARMRSIGAGLAAHSLDAIAIQEVWTEAWREILVDAGRAAGLGHIWHNQATVGGSGLLVMSRQPILEADFRRFSVCGLPERIDHADYYSGKGFAVLRMGSELGEWLLVNTHLVAQYTSDGSDLYRGQRVGELVELAQTVASSSLPVVALGDFNIREDGGLYDIWTGLAGVRDVAAELGRRQPTVLAANPYREDGAEDGRIDYGFVRDGAATGWQPRSIERVFDDPREFGGEAGADSDHAGLLVELSEVEAAGPPPLPEDLALTQAARWLDRGRGAARSRRRTRRALGLGSLAVACGASAAAVSPRLQRRTFLKLGAGSLAAAGFAGAAGLGALSEHFIPEELAGFQQVERALAKLRALRDRGAGASGAEAPRRAD
ncbi:MAG: endonuclease/exonuclease/phosphatase family protein [Myxococcota bacterium]